MIGGGYANTIWNANSVIAGGIQNSIGTQSSIYGEIGHSIGGGTGNAINYQNFYSTIGGGLNNFVDGSEAVIGGGSGNRLSGRGLPTETRSWEDMETLLIAPMGKHYRRRLLQPAFGSAYSVIAGGSSNSVTGNSGTISAYSVIGGGQSNIIGTTFGTIGGGSGNTVTTNANNSTIAGGQLNQVSGSTSIGPSSPTNSSISGGSGNQIYEARSAIGGGISNQIGGSYSSYSGPSGHTISGGTGNSIGYQNRNSTIGGGLSNLVAGSDAVISGGSGNQI